MKKMLKVGNLVYIEWSDSFGVSPGWERIPENHEPEVMICRSVGWVTARGKKAVVVVPHTSSHQKDGCGDMTIPLAAIVRVKKLNGPKRLVG